MRAVGEIKEERKEYSLFFFFFLPSENNTTKIHLLDLYSQLLNSPKHLNLQLVISWVSGGVCFIVMVNTESTAWWVWLPKHCGQHSTTQMKS